MVFNYVKFKLGNVVYNLKKQLDAPKPLKPIGNC